MGLSRRNFSLAAIVAAGCARMPAPAARTPRSMDAAWERMLQTLPGTWEGTGELQGLVIRYRMVSGGSTLLETFGAAEDRQTISLYHRDGDGLMMTHYCGQGNQARLVAAWHSGPSVRFEHLDATGVTAEQSVLHRLSFVLGAGKHERIEVYRAADGSEETGRYDMVRAGGA